MTQGIALEVRHDKEICIGIRGIAAAPARLAMFAVDAER